MFNSEFMVCIDLVPFERQQYYVFTRTDQTSYYVGTLSPRHDGKASRYGK